MIFAVFWFLLRNKLNLSILVRGCRLALSISDKTKEWKIGVRCPRCSSPIRDLGFQPFCSNAVCEYNKTGFPVINGQPVLIDFATSIFDRSMYQSNSEPAIDRDLSGRSLGSRLHRFAFGKNPVAATNCAKFLSLLKDKSAGPHRLGDWRWHHRLRR